MAKIDDARRKKILFVDDEPDFLHIMGRRIESWGFDVVYANNGEEGIDAIMSANPDLVILDYRMPKMDGITTLEKMREINENIPVIMFTAYQDERSVKGTQKLGVTAFIPKFSLYSESASVLRTALNMALKVDDKEG